MHTPTKFWLYKAIGDSQIVSSNSLSVDHPKQSEFGRQRVHDHWQVSLSNLRMKKWKLRFRGNVGRGTGWNRGNWWWKKGNKNANKLKFCNLLFAASSIFISVCYISQNGFWLISKKRGLNCLYYSRYKKKSNNKWFEENQVLCF